MQIYETSVPHISSLLPDAVGKPKAIVHGNFQNKLSLIKKEKATRKREDTKQSDQSYAQKAAKPASKFYDSSLVGQSSYKRSGREGIVIM